jgi:hypothetical protein
MSGYKLALYSLFAKVDGKWRRLSGGAAILAQARLLFQGSLLSGSAKGYRMELRRVIGPDPNYDRRTCPHYAKVFGAPEPFVDYRAGGK